MAIRYKGIKGKLWEVFSRFIRIRDYIKYKRCISCGQFLHWKDGDAGHFVAAGNRGFGLLFDEQNVALQCKGCNNPTWTPDASIPFGIELDKRCGVGTSATLWERRLEINKVWTDGEYKEKIEYYKEQIKEFEKENEL